MSKFILSPERVPKLLNLLIACLKDSTSDKNRVVSSANCPILKALPSTVMPLMFISHLMFIARISATRINNSAEIGHPCLIPLLKVKKFEI